MELLSLPTLFIALLSFVIYLVLKYPNNAIGTRYRPELKGPKGWPILGNIDLVFKYDNGIMLLYDISKEYGPVVTTTLPAGWRFIQINVPNLLEHVLKNNFENYVKGPDLRELMYQLFGDGIFTADGTKWKIQRRLISYLFQAKKFREIICVVFQQETKLALQIFNEISESDEVIDLQEFFNRFTLDAFVRISFGVDLGCLSSPKTPIRFAKELDFVQSTIDNRFRCPLWKITEHVFGVHKKMQESCDYIDQFAYNIIKKKKEKQEEKRANGENEGEDLLSMFMNSVDDDGEKLSDKELKDIVLNLIIAGRDTTAQALSWMMSSVMEYPNVEENILKEANSLLTSDEGENSIPNYDTVKLFQYTRATFYETLRLFPSVPVNIRMCIKDDILPNGIPIYAGEFITWNSWGMGRDKTIWGENANQFIPERWLNNEFKPNQFKFISFNAGPRICLGQQFATIEAITLTSVLLKNFKFELLPEQQYPPDFSSSITFPMKNPLLVKVHKR